LKKLKVSEDVLLNSLGVFVSQVKVVSNKWVLQNEKEEKAIHEDLVVIILRTVDVCFSDLIRVAI
jgi:hypothetical protein